MRLSSVLENSRMCYYVNIKYVEEKTAGADSTGIFKSQKDSDARAHQCQSGVISY